MHALLGAFLQAQRSNTIALLPLAAVFGAGIGAFKSTARLLGLGTDGSPRLGRRLCEEPTQGRRSLQQVRRDGGATRRRARWVVRQDRLLRDSGGARPCLYAP